MKTSAAEEPASPSAAAEENPIARMIGASQRDFPECNFAALVFDMKTHAVRKSTFSENVSAEMAEFVEDNFTIPEFFSVSKLSFDGVWVDISTSLLAKAGKMDITTAAMCKIGPELGLLLLAWREKSFGAFKAPDLDAISSLFGSLRAFLESCCDQQAELNRALDLILGQLGIGLVVVSDTMAIVHTNPIAESVLAEGGNLARMDNALWIVDTAARGRIERNLAFLRKNAGTSQAEAPIVPLPAMDGAEPLRLSLMPLRNSPHLGLNHIALTISHSPRNTEVSVEKLRGIGLTNAEANLAAAMLKGTTVTQYAEAKGLAVPTVRAHLARIMMRLNVHRQSDLVRTLMSMF